MPDLTAVLLALGLYPLFLLVPGYVVGWFGDVLAFRQRGPVARIVLAVALSASVCPIVTYIAARFVGFWLVWLIYALCWLAFLIRLVLGARRLRLRPALADRRHRRVLVAAGLIALAWVALAILVLADIQVGNRLYISALSIDYTKHVAFTAAITRTGVPPANPYYHPGQSVQLCYYYLWHLICSLVERLGGPAVGARAAAIAGTSWAGLALMAAVALHLDRTDQPRRRRIRRTVVGLGLLLVSGLDVIPVLLANTTHLIARIGPFYADLEWWNEQVTAWLGAMLWVPQHVAGLAACLTGLLLFLGLRQPSSKRESALLILLCGLALASGAGLSLYLTLVFAAFFGLWLLWSLWLHQRDVVARVLLVGAAALLLGGPFLWDMQRASQIGRVPIVPTVRSFLPLEALLLASGPHPAWLYPLANLLALPLNYMMELGFFLFAAIAYWQARRRTGLGYHPDDTWQILLLVSSLAICTFGRSDIKNNDLGWRAAMPAQFVLLLWAVEPTLSLLGWSGEQSRGSTTARRQQPRGLIAMLLLGLLTTTLDLALLKSFPVLADRYGIRGSLLFGPVSQSARRAYDLRLAYSWTRANLPADAIVQYNPNVRVDIYQGLYGDRQVVAGGYDNGVMFGVLRPAYNLVADRIAPLFAEGARDPAAVDEVCSEYSIDALVVKDTDPAWGDRQSWVWQREPAFATDLARVFVFGHRVSNASQGS